MNAYSKKYLDFIVDALFRAEEAYLTGTVDKLNTKNCEITQSICYGFTHKGKRFMDSRFKNIVNKVKPEHVPVLSLQLLPELKLFDSVRKQIAEDAARIRQALVPLLVNSLDVQDIRNSLPECVVSLIPHLAAMPRTRENVLTNIQSDRFAVAAYEKALPLMERYSVSALIF